LANINLKKIPYSEDSQPRLDLGEDWKRWSD